MLTIRLIGAIFRRGPRHGVFDRVTLWRRRLRQRRDLMKLDDRLLRDIGLDSAAARREFSKSFWEA